MQKELLERLKNMNERFTSLKKNLNLDEKRIQLTKFQDQMQKIDFWNNQKQAQQISQQASSLEGFLNNWASIQSALLDLPELITGASESDAALLEEEVLHLEKKFEENESETLLSGEHDQGNAIVSLHVGNGGQDAEDFTQILERMYLRFCEGKGWKVQILDESFSDVGLKSATLEITGSLSYGLLKGEHGVHR
ncbi:PCRF domain-containing protein, partial [Candidatus Gracilibacteria bacterium]|nr:PCRF domain-containing protein [Candidatus Gracilibacteria bacterium]